MVNREERITESERRCVEKGGVYVRSHKKEDGTYVRGFCRKRGVEKSDGPKKYSSYREIEEDLDMDTSDAQAWAEVHRNQLKGNLKKEVDEWNNWWKENQSR